MGATAGGYIATGICWCNVLTTRVIYAHVEFQNIIMLQEEQVQLIDSCYIDQYFVYEVILSMHLA